MNEQYEVECKDLLKKLYKNDCTQKQLIHKLKKKMESLRKIMMMNY